MSAKRELPVGWAQATVAEVASAPAVYGILQPGPDQPDGVPYVRPTEIQNDAIQVADLRRTSKQIAAKYKRSSLAHSDIVLSIVGTIGKVALVPLELVGANITQSSARIRLPSELLLPRFGAYALRSPLLVTQFNVARLGTAVPRLNLAHVRELLLPVAPLAEQHRIVGAIESYFTRLDDAVATLERVQRNLKRYRASVLKAAVEGRLVPTEAELARAEGRDYEPASVLLERIFAERRRRWEEAELAKMKAKGRVPKDDTWKAKYKEPVAPNSGDLPELPCGWCWTSVDQLECGDRRSAYGVLVPGPDVPLGVPLVRVGDIYGGRVDSTRLKRIDRKIADKFGKTYLQGGEVLLTLVGTIGRTAVVPSGLAGANVARAVGVIPASDLVNPHWVEFWFRSPAIHHRMIGKAHEVARKTLNLEDVRCAPVALAPQAEQDRICEAVEDAESVIDAIDGAADHSALRCTRLRQAILKWAFEGRLVDQDPTDEPASELLERIRAERQSKPAQPAQPARTQRRARATKDRP